MQCKCGGDLSTSHHPILTKKGLKDWFEGDADLPCQIEQRSCVCGRAGFRVFDKHGKIIRKKGI